MASRFEGALGFYRWDSATPRSGSTGSCGVVHSPEVAVAIFGRGRRVVPVTRQERRAQPGVKPRQSASRFGGRLTGASELPDGAAGEP
jgi:hypothetical protein